MKDKIPSRSYRPAIAAMLSILFCGLGQIYLHRVFKGVVLALSFLCAIMIIWIAVSGREFNLVSWGEKQLMFSPSQRSVSFRGQIYEVTDIMKLTGLAQFVFTWVFSIADAWMEGKRRGEEKAG